MNPQASISLWPSVVLALLLGCSAEAPSPDVVASTSLGEITAAELESYILAQPEAQRAPQPGTEVAAWRERLLRQMIIARAAEAEARELGLDSTEETRAILAAQREPILVEEVRRRVLAERAGVSEEDLRAFYEANPEEFGHPEQIRVRNIYRRVEKSASEETWRATQAEMEDYVARIRGGARFEDLAKAHSDSETAPIEGLIGRLNRGTLDPKLEEILWNLDEGELSPVLRTPNGFQLFRVDSHLGTFKMPFEEARTRLRRRLTRERTEAVESEYLEELVTAAAATLDRSSLRGDPEEVLFSLGDETLTVEEFHDYLGAMSFWQARRLTPEEHLEGFARERLYVWEAERSELATEPGIAEALEESDRAVLVAAALERRRREFLGKIPEDDLRAFFEETKERFRTPKLFRIRILTRTFPEDESQWYGLREEVATLASELRAGRRDFAEAARALSADFSAGAGGDVGAIRSDSMAEWAGPESGKLLAELSPGEVSDPILIERFNTSRMTYDREGYLLILLEAVEESRVREFEEVEDRVVERFVDAGDRSVNERVRQAVLDSVSTRFYPENL